MFVFVNKSGPNANIVLTGSGRIAIGPCRSFPGFNKNRIRVDRVPGSGNQFTTLAVQTGLENLALHALLPDGFCTVDGLAKLLFIVSDLIKSLGIDVLNAGPLVPATKDTLHAGQTAPAKLISRMRVHFPPFNNGPDF